MSELLKSTDILGTLKTRGACDRAAQAFADSSFNIPPFEKSYGTWLEHTLSWEKQTQLELLVIRYEDMILNPERQASRLSEYLGVSNKAMNCAFNFRQNATLSAKSKDAQSNQPSFYNKLTAGYFRDYISQEIMAAITTEKARDLKNAGYGDLLDLLPAR